MEGCYDVAYDGNICGTVKMDRQGLYWKLSCRCNGLRQGLYRLYAGMGQGSLDLGLLYPIENGFGLDTRMPCKLWKDPKPAFRLQIKKHSGHKIQLKEDASIDCLQCLDDCRYEVIDGQPYLILPDEKND